jgi:phosphoribosylpyrophosphate synthetase
MTKLPPKTLLMALRVAPSVWASLHTAVQETNDPSVMLWQGMSKTHSDGPINPGLFARAQYDDHPGPATPPEEIKKILKALRDPNSVVHVFNSAAGQHANDRLLCAMTALSEIIEEYKNKGGARAVVFHMLYDSAGRNDKVHRVHSIGTDGTDTIVSEHNTPFGVMLPLMLRRLGVDFMTAFDPHSFLTSQNYARAFRNQSVTILSNINPIAQGIIEKHRESILDGTFRLGAPDGWDKKDKLLENMATQRVRDVAEIIWNKLPELRQNHTDFESFLKHVQFGIIKQRQSQYPGQAAKPVVVGFDGDVAGCVCVLLDDLSDTGGSVIQSGIVLRNKGAKRVDAALCHGPPYEETLQKILHETTFAGGHTSVVIDNLIITNTMARVEAFHMGLGIEGKRRVHMVNSGNALVDHLCNPVPHRDRLPEPSLLRGITLE